MKLSSKQIKYLRSVAMTIDAKWRLGKDGLTDNFINNFTDYINIHEMAKISLLQNCDEDKKVVANAIADATDSILVQVIGKTIIIFKPNKEGQITQDVKRIK